MGLAQVVIYVHGLERMLAFYAGALGATPCAGGLGEGWVELDLGAGTLVLHAIPAAYREPGDPPPSGAPREDAAVKPVFAVPDPAAAVARAVGLGGRAERRPWGAVDLVDPEGNVLGLVERARV